MNDSASAKEYFFCRKGMKRIGPLSRNTLRRYLAAGLIDAHTLVSHNDDGCMLPLGASDAAGEITSTVCRWQKQFSLPIFLLWLLVMPLFSAFFAAMAVYAAGHSWSILLGSAILAQAGMSYWLWWTWNLLLVDKPHWAAWVYALPMALPVVNAVWIWIGYMPLAGYYRQYRSKVGVDEYFPLWIYYLAVLFFYMMLAGMAALCFGEGNAPALLVYAVGCVSWLWLGMTLFSLFVADCFTTRVLQKKLSNLAFGSLQFGANIDYNALHRTVLAVALSSRKKSRILSVSVLLASYLAGGWFWLHSLEYGLVHHDEDAVAYRKKCIVCAPRRYLMKKLHLDHPTLVNSNTVRQGR